MALKTSDYYEAKIRELYPTVKLLEAYCEADPEDKETAKELEKKKGTLGWYKDQWAERIPVKVYVDGREQLENTPEELRCPTEQTPQYDKTSWPYRSVGDYIAYVQGIGWYHVCRERKSLPDLYGTLMDDDNRENLFEEFDRFLADDRFTIFRFDLECTEEEFYNYLPQWPKTCKFCEVKREKMDSGEYFCPRTKSILDFYPGSDFKCHEGFVERKRADIDIKRLRTLKEKWIKRCFEKGFQIIWRGSREAAYQAYSPGVEEWLKLSYVGLLGLDNPFYNDHTEQLKNKAILEEKLKSVTASLERIEARESQKVGVEI